MIFFVHVGVALERPPGTDEVRRYAVEAPDWPMATLISAQMAQCTSVMPVWAEVVGDEEVGSYVPLDTAL